MARKVWKPKHLKDIAWHRQEPKAWKACGVPGMERWRPYLMPFTTVPSLLPMHSWRTLSKLPLNPWEGTLRAVPAWDGKGCRTLKVRAVTGAGLGGQHGLGSTVVP